MATLFPLMAAVVLVADSDLERYQSLEVHMGTKFEIVLFAPTEALADQAAKAAYARIAELDQKLSDYRPESELNRLSRSSPTPSPVAVSNDLSRVLWHAQALSGRSEGGFDVTVGPLSKLWRRARRRKEFPAADRMSEARAAVGFQLMKVDRHRSTVELLRPNMRLDLGAIAKGFAGDEALRATRELGIGRVLINAGGDIVAGDAPPGEEGWRVGIARLEPDAEPSRFLCVANAAVATSGDSWQYVEIDGQRYSHILDPRTGLGLTARSSVTVIATDGMTADSLASAVSVLGASDGLKLIEESADAEALVVFLGANGLRMAESSGFPAHDSER